MKKRYNIEAVSPNGAKTSWGVDAENYAAAEFNALQKNPGYCILGIKLIGHYIDGFLFSSCEYPTVPVK